jgi:hypothetical protein
MTRPAEFVSLGHSGMLPAETFEIKKKNNF